MEKWKLLRSVARRVPWLRSLKRAWDAAQNMSPVADAIESAIAPRLRELRENALILDVGTGRGHSREWDVARIRRRYLSLDIDPSVRPHVAADGCELPFADGTFDAVTATSVMLLIERPDKLFREAARVLRPGGVALIYAELLAYWCMAGGTEVDIQRYTAPRLRHLTRCFDTVTLVPVGSHHTFYANMLWRYRRTWHLGPLRRPLGMILGGWAKLGGTNPESPVGHLVVGRKSPRADPAL